MIVSLSGRAFGMVLMIVMLLVFVRLLMFLALGRRSNLHQVRARALDDLALDALATAAAA